ncbi:hypothetical protein BLS_001662 [Venturia inaequalis]|uniref:Rhodopsin domain-containing protein n=1 Tax=Venturia inaequalis TaxID=5025 RepID=A0A8H3U928_VENIN|nr:hypothetical protein EG328_011378 [Venturia inaequalis]KAE9966002.1 hypothetical protein EG327_000259 [Venturia inaequalis]KAE9984667.1 hypothetical protein BLS_001662 [Venturia inaequalis]
MLQKPRKDNRGPEVRIVIISFLAVSWVTVLARCWVRIKMIKAFALDDWLTVFTLQLFTVYSSFVLIGAHWGCGRRHHDLTVKQRVNAMHAWYFGEIFYILTTTLLRFAVGAFLLRVATKNLHRRIIYACFAVNVVFNIYFLSFTVFQCTPVDGFWTRMRGTKEVVCHPEIAVNSTYASSAVSATIDWIFGLLPIWIIENLQINRRRKIALGAIMGLGAVASVAPIVRIPYTISLAHSDDFLWSTVDASIWSSVEPGIGLIAISLAALRPLFASMLAGFSTGRGTTEKSASKHLGSEQYGSNHYRNLNNLQSVAAAHTQPRPSLNTAWEEEEENGLELRGLPPPIGHFVSIEGGSAKRGSAKLQKSASTNGSNAKSWASPKRSMSVANSEEGFFGDKHTITMTQDFKHYSGSGSDILFFDKR